MADWDLSDIGLSPSDAPTPTGVTQQTGSQDADAGWDLSDIGLQPVAQPTPAPAAPAAAPVPAKGVLGHLDDYVRALAGGITGHFDDEIAAGADALIGHYFGRGSQADGISQRYQEDLANERARNASISPIVSIPGEIAGGVAQATLAAPLIAAAAPARVAQAVSALPRVVQGIGAGAAQGALYGFGSGEGGLGNRLTGAAEGAGIGAAATGAAEGVIGGLRAAGRTIRTYTAPFAQAGREGAAGQVIADAATDLPAARAALDNPAAPLVPGSAPTTAQATEDTGLLALEKATRTAQPEAFVQRAADQNAARVGAIDALPDGTGSPQEFSDFFRRHLDDMHAADTAAADNLRPSAEAALRGTGADTTEQAAGSAVRGAVDAQQAPLVTAADRAVASGEGAVAAADQALPQAVTGADNQTVLQGIGTRLRAGLDGLNQEARAREGAFWENIDPNGTLVADAQPIKSKAQQIIADMSPVARTASPQSATEAAIFQAATSLDNAVPFRFLGDLRSSLTTAIRTARVAGEDQSVRRMSQLLSGVDASMSGSVGEKAAQDAAAVRAGTMAPENAMGSRLAQEAQALSAARQTEARTGTANGRSYQGGSGAGPSGVPGAYGTEVQGGGQSRAASRGASLQSPPNLTPNFDADAQSRYAAARQETADRAATYKAAPGVGDVLRSGPQRGDFRLPTSEVPARLFSGSGVAEKAQAFLNAGGNRADLNQAAQDYITHQFRRASTGTDGAFSAAGYRRFANQNSELLNFFPDLRTRFGTLADAQGQLAQAQAAREALTRSHPLNPGWGDSDVIGQYVQRGPGGAEGIARLMQDTGNSPSARKAAEDTLALRFRDYAAPNGVVDPKRAAMFTKQHESALSALPDLRARLSGASTAQEAVNTAAEAAKANRTAYEKSVASSFLNGQDPTRALGSLLNGSTAANDLREVAQLVQNDPAAKAGMQRALADYVLSRFSTNSPAGQTGTNFLKADGIQTFVREKEAALRAFLSPEQVGGLKNIAADIQRSKLSDTTFKTAGSDTAQNLSLLQRLLDRLPENTGKVAGYGASGGLGLVLGTSVAGPIGAILGSAAGAAVSALRQAGVRQINDLVVQAMLDPELARALLRKVTPTNMHSIGRDLTTQLVRLGAVQATPTRH